MAFSLYDCTIPSYLQTLAAVAGFLERGQKHFRDNGADPEAIVLKSLAPDMWPLRQQVVSLVHHSRGAWEGVCAGRFAPPADKRPHDFAALQALTLEARDLLAKVRPDEVDALLGRDLVFEVGGRQMTFLAQDFLLSFSLPNFYFHSTTAYDILRHNGVPLGKRDFLGRLRLKP